MGVPVLPGVLSKEMKQKDPYNGFIGLVVRHLSGELSPEEDRRFLEVIEKSAEKRKLFEEYRKIWESAASAREQQEYDLEAEWRLMSKKISESSQGTGSRDKPESSAPPGKRRRTGTTRSLWSYTYRIAAILVMGLIIASGVFFAVRMTGSERVMAKNEPVETTLSDGTRVTLNRYSVLRFKKTFREDQRRADLKGEAFFEVAEDPSRPFRIHAGKALVEVLGTRFNVDAYRDQSAVLIAVESGLVALSPRKDPQEQIVLRAGNSGTYNRKNKQLELDRNADPNLIAWKTKELYFDSTPLKEVVDLVNEVYNTHLVIKDPSLAGCPITVTFKQQSLESVLHVLERTLDLKITRDGERIILEGEGCAES
jgi:ferric-dicitrate binding protein FerR (iron transport regulator)